MRQTTMLLRWTEMSHNDNCQTSDSCHTSDTHLNVVYVRQCWLCRMSRDTSLTYQLSTPWCYWCVRSVNRRNFEIAHAHFTNVVPKWYENCAEWQIASNTSVRRLLYVNERMNVCVRLQRSYRDDSPLSDNDTQIHSEVFMLLAVVLHCVSKKTPPLNSL